MSGCPTPEKVAHRSQKAAEKAWASLVAQRGMDLLLKPYPCGNHWHLGHHAVSGGGDINAKIRRLGRGRAMSRRRA